MKIATLIVNYNNPQLLDERIREVLTLNTKLFILDNGSKYFIEDKKVIQFQEKGVEFYKSKDNLGYGKALNFLIKHYDITNNFDFIFLLNSDCSINKSYFNSIHKFLENEASIDILAPLLFDGENLYFGSQLRFPLLNTKLIKNPAYDYAAIKFSWPTAAALFLKTEIIIDDILFDPYYFMYWEDADMILRYKSTNIKIHNFYIDNDSYFKHLPGMSSANIVNERYIWHLDGMLYFFKKYTRFHKFLKPLVYFKFIFKGLLDLQFHRTYKIIKRCF
jgi:GT2 family glycosyltransferase